MAKFFAYLIGWLIQISILAGFFYLFMFISEGCLGSNVFVVKKKWTRDVLLLGIRHAWIVVRLMQIAKQDRKQDESHPRLIKAHISILRVEQWLAMLGDRNAYPS